MQQELEALRELAGVSMTACARNRASAAAAALTAAGRSRHGWQPCGAASVLVVPELHMQHAAGWPPALAPALAHSSQHSTCTLFTAPPYSTLPPRFPHCPLPVFPHHPFPPSFSPFPPPFPHRPIPTAPPPKQGTYEQHLQACTQRNAAFAVACCCHAGGSGSRGRGRRCSGSRGTQAAAAELCSLLALSAAGRGALNRCGGWRRLLAEALLPRLGRLLEAGRGGRGGGGGNGSDSGAGSDGSDNSGSSGSSDGSDGSDDSSGSDGNTDCSSDGDDDTGMDGVGDTDVRDEGGSGGEGGNSGGKEGRRGDKRRRSGGEEGDISGEGGRSGGEGGNVGGQGTSSGGEGGGGEGGQGRAKRARLSASPCSNTVAVHPAACVVGGGGARGEGCPGASEQPGHAAQHEQRSKRGEEARQGQEAQQGEQGRKAQRREEVQQGGPPACLPPTCAAVKVKPSLSVGDLQLLQPYLHLVAALLFDEGSGPRLGQLREEWEGQRLGQRGEVWEGQLCGDSGVEGADGDVKGGALRPGQLRSKWEGQRCWEGFRQGSWCEGRQGLGQDATGAAGTGVAGTGARCCHAGAAVCCDAEERGVVDVPPTAAGCAGLRLEEVTRLLQRLWVRGRAGVLVEWQWELDAGQDGGLEAGQGEAGEAGVLIEWKGGLEAGHGEVGEGQEETEAGEAEAEAAVEAQGSNGGIGKRPLQGYKAGIKAGKRRRKGWQALQAGGQGRRWGQQMSSRAAAVLQDLAAVLCRLAVEPGASSGCDGDGDGGLGTSGSGGSGGSSGNGGSGSGTGSFRNGSSGCNIGTRVPHNAKDTGACGVLALEAALSAYPLAFNDAVSSLLAQGQGASSSCPCPRAAAFLLHHWETRPLHLSQTPAAVAPTPATAAAQLSVPQPLTPSAPQPPPQFTPQLPPLCSSLPLPAQPPPTTYLHPQQPLPPPPPSPHPWGPRQLASHSLVSHFLPACCHCPLPAHDSACVLDALRQARGQGALGQPLPIVGQDVSLVKAGVKAPGLEAGEAVTTERCVRWMEVRGARGGRLGWG